MVRDIGPTIGGGWPTVPSTRGRMARPSAKLSLDCCSRYLGWVNISCIRLIGGSGVLLTRALAKNTIGTHDPNVNAIASATIQNGGRPSRGARGAYVKPEVISAEGCIRSNQKFQISNLQLQI